MGKDTSISWCHHTFSIWHGCFKISPACTNCYAQAFDHRLGRDNWQRTGPRRFQSESYWQQPLKWNAAAAKADERRRVFCGSMNDWAEVHPDPEINRQMDAYRGRLFEFIKATPHLDWLLLTKRPENIAAMLPPDWGGGYPNVWLGTTVEDQDHTWRIEELAAIPARVRFLSCEPLLGPLALGLLGVLPANRTGGAYVLTWERIHWVIVGCESGHGARKCDVAWIRALRDECAETGTHFFLKQATQPSDSDQKAWRTFVTIGDGSFVKGRGFARAPVIELPYLDGQQHASVPGDRAANLEGMET